MRGATSLHERPGRLLFVDDERAMCELVEAALGADDLEVTWVQSGQAALERIACQEFDVVVSDLNMGAMDGLELCRRLGESHPEVPVVLLTAFGSMDSAIQAVRMGAYDFVTKPIEMRALGIVVWRAVTHRRLTSEVARLRREVGHPREYSGIVGDSPAMRQLFELLPRAARADVPVHIAGESGTGKELVARALHDTSARSGGPFIAINCAALPEALLESELFGHVRGAFTDARADRSGLFVQANGGTLFLDEIGDLPLGLQPKLLRALQERRVRPVGANTEVDISCRIVSASHRDLAEAIEEGSFREDLYYRLNVIQLDLPPLRDRAGDILTLAQHFLQKAAERSGSEVSGLTTAASRMLLAYPWPGNVRELENCMERAVALTRHGLLVPDDLPPRVREPAAAATAPGHGLIPLEEVERRHILRVLNLVEGRRAEAARILGVDRKTLYRKLERFAAE